MTDLLVTIVVVIAGGVGIFFAGRKSGAKKEAVKQAERDADTRERMQDAESELGDDPAALRDWLRQRGQR